MPTINSNGHSSGGHALSNADGALLKAKEDGVSNALVEAHDEK
jgi:hypothetical protein